jgi:hypothetical protein
MPILLEAEVESLHASAAAFLRLQSSSLRDHQKSRIQDSGFGIQGVKDEGPGGGW